MKRSSPHTLGVLVALSCPACDLASRSLGEFVEPRPQRGDLDLDQADGLSHLTVPAIDTEVEVVPLGDLDVDGYDDWAVVKPDMSGAGRVYLLYGRGDGYPADAQLESIADAIFTVDPGASEEESSWLDIRALGDLDADGYLDVALAVDDVASDDIGNYARTSSVHILWGAEERTGGTLRISSLPLAVSTASGFPARTSLRLHGAGDLDGDGAADVMLRAEGALASNSLTLFQGPRPRAAPLSSERARPVLDGQFEGAWGFVAGSDLDRDGFDDVVLTEGEPAGWRVSVVFGAPSGDLDVSLASPGRRFTSAMATAADVGDVNGDGAPDLLIDVGGLAKVFAGPFARAQDPVVLGSTEDPPNPYRFAAAIVGDIDGDGDEDLAVSREVANDGTDVVGLYLGGPAFADAVEGIAAVVEFISAPVRPAEEETGASPIGLRLGDVNGDGFEDWAALVRPACSGACERPIPLHVIYGASYG